jgi:hypothetical protein
MRASLNVQSLNFCTFKTLCPPHVPLGETCKRRRGCRTPPAPLRSRKANYSVRCTMQATKRSKLLETELSTGEESKPVSKTKPHCRKPSHSLLEGGSR